MLPCLPSVRRAGANRAPIGPRWIAPFLLLASALTGCATDLGPCDVQAARTVVYTDDSLGLPAYAGQALIIQSCGAGSFCHAASATDRLGVPEGLDFDLRLASTAAEMERLRQDQWTTYRYRDSIWHEVKHGFMPPGAVGREVEASGPVFRDLPPLESPEGRAILENWLSCGVPVVERTANDRPPGVEPVGAIVAAVPTVDASSCSAGLQVCSQMCVDTMSDPMNCGSCGVVCGAGLVCSMGSCSATCAAGETMCSSSCVDTNTSSLNCGGCNMPCASNEVCTNAMCVCAAGLTACAGSCVDTSTDKANCGACGMACGAGQSCQGGMCAKCGAGISFANDVQPVFTNSCGGRTGCHLTNTRPAGNLDLLAGQAYGNLVNVPSNDCSGRTRVVPGSPDTSYLVDKLLGMNMCSGVQMPAASGALPAATIQMIEGWICAGAPNN